MKYLAEYYIIANKLSFDGPHPYIKNEVRRFDAEDDESALNIARDYARLSSKLLFRAKVTLLTISKIEKEILTEPIRFF